MNWVNYSSLPKPDLFSRLWELRFPVAYKLCVMSTQEFDTWNQQCWFNTPLSAIRRYHWYRINNSNMTGFWSLPLHCGVYKLFERQFTNNSHANGTKWIHSIGPPLIQWRTNFYLLKVRFTCINHLRKRYHQVRYHHLRSPTSPLQVFGGHPPVFAASCISPWLS